MAEPTATSEIYWWWGWWVQCGVAIGTIGATLFALFGDWLKARYFPPKLVASLRDARGTWVLATLKAADGGERPEDSRWYHITVSNLRPWRFANQVQVFLTRIEERGPANDKYRSIYDGAVPIPWVHHGLTSYPPLRTIGLEADCDAFSITKGKFLCVHPLIYPGGMKAHWREEAHIILTFEVRSVEGKSAPLRVRVDWDGQWKDGKEEMSDHAVVQVI